MKKHEKNNRGVTLISLIIMLIIMGILVATIAYNVLNRNTMSKLDDLYNDLTLLEERYKAYYAQNGKVPLENKYENLEEILEKIADVRNPNDNDEYYYVGTDVVEGTHIINSSLLGDISLKSSGTFIVNEKTLTVYYLNGVKVNGKTYYTLPREYSQISTIEPENVGNISNGSWNDSKRVNSPQLLEGMTPVYWDKDGNEHQLTNSSTEEEWDKWYDYHASKWANATTKDGSYWVWIPRYEYKIKTPGTATASEIWVKFVKTSQTTPDEDYDYIHPAFTDGRKNEFENGEWDKEIPGFWVAKYVAGFQASSLNKSETLINGGDTVIYSDNYYTSFNPNQTTNALGQNLTEANYATQKLSYPVFKPLTYVYNLIGAGDCYTISQNIAKATEFYGLNSKTTDSHLSKNSEYGAVAYLTHSAFGRNGTLVATNLKNINNTTKYINGVTGYSGTTPLGALASSTNNMSGVFDLAGAAGEETAAYLANNNENLKKYAKVFTQYDEQTGKYEKKSTKYCTVYKIGNIDTTVDNYNLYKELNTNKNYGDSILEVSYGGSSEQTTWFGWGSKFPSTNLVFFFRNISFVSGEGNMFSFHGVSGIPGNTQSFRTVLIGK